jgi:hypothetical protein
MKAIRTVPIPIVARVVNENGTMATGKTVNYSIRKGSDQSLYDSGTLTEMTDHAGIYFKEITGSVNEQYVVVVECSGYPTDAKHLLVSDAENEVNTIFTKLPAGDFADEATLTAMKGSGWTGNEDLFNIKQIVEASEDTVNHVIYGLSALKVLIDALQTDLDNPNQFKADISSLALESTLTAIKDLIDTLQTDATAIKAKTDTIDWGDITDLVDVELGEWILDPVAHTLTLKRQGGSTLKVFDLTQATGAVPSYAKRTPQ